MPQLDILSAFMNFTIWEKSDDLIGLRVIGCVYDRSTSHKDSSNDH